jgi:hypothetical protein
MNAPSFDPVNSFRFDLGQGQIEASDKTTRVLLPAEALGQLLAGLTGEAVGDFGHLIGGDMGRRISERLQDAGRAPAPALLEHLGGEIALAGLGNAKLERWGQALVIAIVGVPFADRGEVLLSGILEGALARALSRQVSAVALGREGNVLRFALLGTAGAERVRVAISGGASFAQALAKLQ